MIIFNVANPYMSVEWIEFCHLVMMGVKNVCNVFFFWAGLFVKLYFLFDSLIIIHEFNSFFSSIQTDVPIWSKITTGRIPSANELIDMIDNQHKFFQPETFGTGGSGDHLTSHTITGRTL